MNTSNRYLTALLILLVGILLGGIFVMMQQGQIISDRSGVRFTEIETSDRPLFSDAELEKLDSRFLFKSVADRVLPTVVYISTVVSINGEQGEEGEERNFWDRLQPRRARTVGSGVIVSENGYIVTNNHVIDGAVDEGISVALNDKRLYEARVVGADPTTDLAILKIDARNLPAITLGNSDEVDVGEWVLAVGNPFRLRSTVTAGIVSALSRQVQLSNGSDQLRIESFIQTDAAINKGNSGGALVNTGGELVGINTAIATESGNYQGYGFAVPSNLVRKVMSDLIEYGEVHRALLGVSILGVDYNRAQQLGMEQVRGVEIMNMTENGAARKHGLQQNDIVLAVDGEEVNESNELQERIAVHSPGDTVELKVWRNGSVIKRSVELGRLESSALAQSRQQEEEEPQEPQYESQRGIAFGSFSIGFKVMALSRSEAGETFDLVISSITPSSEADQQGLREGYVIREVDGNAVESLDELEQALIEGAEGTGSVILKIETPEGATGYYELRN